MAIQSISASTTQGATASPIKDKIVTQDDFLKLLIAQLQNQDPLQPMDNQEFAAQLAQFNSLGQLIDINQKLGTLQNTQAAANQFNATSMIGKEITTYANSLSLPAGDSGKVAYQLGANAAKVVVNVYNEAGELVRQIDAGAQSAGEKIVSWDGNDSAGRRLGAGLYHFEINAIDLSGRRVAAVGRLQGLVTGVKLSGGEPILEVGGLDVPLGRVIGVRAAQ
jgi:flagellar basal-body rod modification protein FlgD